MKYFCTWDHIAWNYFLDDDLHYDDDNNENILP